MADAEGLAGGAEYHLVVGAAAGQAQAVDAYPAGVAAAGFGQMMDGGLVALEIAAAFLAHTSGDGQGEAGGGINLHFVMGFHHVNVVKEGGGLLGELFQHHGAQGKVGSDDDADAMLAAGGVQHLQLVGV